MIGCNMSGNEKILNFNEIIAQTFVEKANCIEKNLAVLNREKLSDDIVSVHEKYDQVRNYSVLRIEKNTDYDFKNPNLFMIVFLYKEISKMFNEVHNRILNGSAHSEVPNEFFLEMRELKENMMTLAFIGDSAIELGVIQSIWPPKDLEKIPHKGTLDNEKKFITVGKNQADLWNFLALYDQKILIQNRDESSRQKSSQFEAIFGIIYLESGLESVEKAIHTLICNYKKKVQ
jgi:dsRNA-specific ribonuclease